MIPDVRQKMPRLRFVLLFAFALLFPAIAFAHGDAHGHQQPAPDEAKLERTAPSKTTHAVDAPASCPNGGGACCCTYDCCSGSSPARLAAASYVVLSLPRAEPLALPAYDPPIAATGLLLTASIGARAPPALH